MKSFATTILIFALFLLASHTAEAQTLQNADIQYQFDMQWDAPDGFNPANRLFFDYVGKGVIAWPSDQAAQVLRFAYPTRQIAPKFTGYIYEFEVSSYRPVSIFGIYSLPCLFSPNIGALPSKPNARGAQVAQVRAGKDGVNLAHSPRRAQPIPQGFCSNVNWMESPDSVDGARKMMPKPTLEQPNPPSFSAGDGDRFAIEWADNGTAQGRFNFYKNRTLVFSLNSTFAADVGDFDTWTISAVFNPSTTIQEMTRTKEIYFLPH